MDDATRRLMAHGALFAPTLHTFTDVLEWVQGGVTPAQLWLNYLAFRRIGAGLCARMAQTRASRCSGDRITPLLDTLLKPAIDNPNVRRIQFILDESQKPIWERDVAPKIAACRDKDKVSEPTWASIQENVSAILSQVAPHGETECLLSFWGEPFMARASGRDIPRYIFHVQGHSELVNRLLELERRYRLGA